MNANLQLSELLNDPRMSHPDKLRDIVNTIPLEHHTPTIINALCDAWKAGRSIKTDVILEIIPGVGGCEAPICNDDVKYGVVNHHHKTLTYHCTFHLSREITQLIEEREKECRSQQ